jgi:hypothetical protein
MKRNPIDVLSQYLPKARRKKIMRLVLGVFTWVLNLKELIALLPL